MTDVTMPARKPARPFFSSGPCAKPPGFSPAKLATESLGRSHRAKSGKSRLQYCIDLMRERRPFIYFSADDGVNDALSGYTGDDDFYAGMTDLLSDFNGASMGTDRRFP